jgi:hypothetical protein
MSRSLFAPRFVTHGGPISAPIRRRSAPRKALAAILGFGVLLPLAGCPDSEAKFKEFLDNTDDDRDFVAPKPDLMASQDDISGTFLLAVSTVIAVDLPMQFIATNTVTTDEMGNQTLTASLQPLSLDQGKVLTPRMPTGEPIDQMNLPLTDGMFVIDAGTLMVTGVANPVTGSDIVATLVMKGTVVDKDFYCGDIEGEVTSPLMADLAGSTFAAVRLEDPMMLPTDVTINCARDTVTEQ